MYAWTGKILRLNISVRIKESQEFDAHVGL